jgi:hypothetical protein
VTRELACSVRGCDNPVSGQCECGRFYCVDHESDGRCPACGAKVAHEKAVTRAAERVKNSLWWRGAIFCLGAAAVGAGGWALYVPKASPAFAVIPTGAFAAAVAAQRLCAAVAARRARLRRP